MAFEVFTAGNGLLDLGRRDKRKYPRRAIIGNSRAIKLPRGNSGVVIGEVTVRTELVSADTEFPLESTPDTCTVFVYVPGEIPLNVVVQRVLAPGAKPLDSHMLAHAKDPSKSAKKLEQTPISLIKSDPEFVTVIVSVTVSRVVAGFGVITSVTESDDWALPYLTTEGRMIETLESTIIKQIRATANEAVRALIVSRAGRKYT